MKKVKICNKCHEEFLTEVDEKGVPYKTRCKKCTEQNKKLRTMKSMQQISRKKSRGVGDKWK